jgi:hypothetical protein
VQDARFRRCFAAAGHQGAHFRRFFRHRRSQGEPNPPDIGHFRRIVAGAVNQMCGWVRNESHLAPQVGLEPTTIRSTGK